MKFLRKPWFVITLAVAALGVVLYNQVLPHLGSSNTKAKAATGPAVATPGPAAASAATAQKPVPAVALTPIDPAYALARFQGWIDAPARDPFLLYIPVAPKAAPQLPALSSLCLKAIWRQTGTGLAVINDKLLGVGDEVSGYPIERIEADQVWLKVAGKLERLDFATYQPGITNAPRGPNAIERFLGPDPVVTARPRS